MNKFDVIKKYIDEYDYYGLLAIGTPNDEYSRGVVAEFFKQMNIAEESIRTEGTMTSEELRASLGI